MVYDLCIFIYYIYIYNHLFPQKESNVAVGLVDLDVYQPSRWAAQTRGCHLLQRRHPPLRTVDGSVAFLGLDA